MIIASENHFLQGTHVLLEDLEPVPVQSDLSHVDVAGWHRFIPSFQSFILNKII